MVWANIGAAIGRRRPGRHRVGPCRAGRQRTAAGRWELACAAAGGAGRQGSCGRSAAGHGRLHPRCHVNGLASGRGHKDRVRPACLRPPTRLPRGIRVTQSAGGAAPCAAGGPAGAGKPSIADSTAGHGARTGNFASPGPGAYAGGKAVLDRRRRLPDRSPRLPRRRRQLPRRRRLLRPRPSRLRQRSRGCGRRSLGGGVETIAQVQDCPRQLVRLLPRLLPQRPYQPLPLRVLAPPRGPRMPDRPGLWYSLYRPPIHVTMTRWSARP
jgi:hypothetical protein